MSFVSVSFAVLYLSAIVFRVATRPGSEFRVLGLLALSWTFYAWHVPAYLALIVFSTVVDYAAARLLSESRLSSPTARRAVLLSSLGLNLGLLGYFKYAGFLVQSFADFAARLGLGLGEVRAPDILLPVGISFYTFQSMSYTIDVYRGRIEAEKSFLRVACYIAFFPQLVAGPIVRAGDFLYQLKRRRRIRLAVFGEGTYLILRGLFLKLVVADNLGAIVDTHWSAAAAVEPGGLLALSMVVFFAVQLFSDFAGYTDIARGVAYQLGFRLPINFRAPYLASTFTDFWRRWHITLSTWMRDYVYVPLGGNRCGAARASVNLIVVMLLAGLWHGASWTFVIWGAVHGTAVAVERALGLTRGAKSRLVAVLWYGVVQMTWILSLGMFRAAGAAQGWRVVRNATAGLVALPGTAIAVPSGEDLVAMGWWFVLPAVVLHGRALVAERWGVGAPSVSEKAVYGGTMLAAILTLYAPSTMFIYFQF